MRCPEHVYVPENLKELNDKTRKEGRKEGRKGGVEGGGKEGRKEGRKTMFLKEGTRTRITGF